MIEITSCEGSGLKSYQQKRRKFVKKLIAWGSFVILACESTRKDSLLRVQNGSGELPQTPPSPQSRPIITSSASPTKPIPPQSKSQNDSLVHGHHRDDSEAYDLAADHQEEEGSKKRMGDSFDSPLPNDIYITGGQKLILLSVVNKLERLQDFVGFGKFNILSFDEALKYSKYSPRLKEFTREELVFMDWIFHKDAKDYGFYGTKVNLHLTDTVDQRKIVKVPYTGHYLFKEEYHTIYLRLRKDVGQSLVLTSGVRGVTKQFLLFLEKTVSVDDNLSQASRSLAPPGYSFHASGDFDVGKKGLGNLNFTNRFSETDEFRKLIDLGYIDIRYPTDNPFGVRYEPWHIEGTKRKLKSCHRCG